jgi:hypothetical protein
MATSEEKAKGRDDFAEQTKARLAAEVGYRCSLPDCGAPTIGPSDTEPKGFSNSGVAAHITAAAPGGPRYDAAVSPDERRSHENGIWCCAKHGRMIDNDPISYTEAQLRAWKADAVDLQRRSHSTGDIDPNGRIKLARTTRHDIAMRAVRAAMKCRSAIMTGVTLSDAAKNIRRVSTAEVPAIKVGMDNWAEEIAKTRTEAEDAMLSIRVSWGIKNGEPAGLQPLINLVGYLEEWRAKFNESMHKIAGIPHPTRTNFGPCDWMKVFNGDQAERALLQTAIDLESSRVETWGAPFIVSRDA